ncbi:hypothetical protein BHM03_00030804 [Ensete ventricosum]|nr:hypothetical protein BHM03_00030804 [Ensete ventricosum]
MTRNRQKQNLFTLLSPPSLTERGACSAKGSTTEYSLLPLTFPSEPTTTPTGPASTCLSRVGKRVARGEIRGVGSAPVGPITGARSAPLGCLDRTRCSFLHSELSRNKVPGPAPWGPP